MRKRTANFTAELSPGPTRNDQLRYPDTKPTSGLVTFDPPKAALKVDNTGLFNVAPSSSKHIHFDDQETLESKEAVTPHYQELEVAKRSLSRER